VVGKLFLAFEGIFLKCRRSEKDSIKYERSKKHRARYSRFLKLLLFDETKLIKILEYKNTYIF